jgi:hypothetical protein
MRGAAAFGARWMWTLRLWLPRRSLTHDYEVIRDSAMAAFAKIWRRQQALCAIAKTADTIARARAAACRYP